MPLVKTVEPVVKQVKPTSETANAELMVNMEDARLPDRFYDYLNLAWNNGLELDKKARKQVNEIWQHAVTYGKAKNTSDVISYVSRLLSKIGAPRGDERSYSKLYNYIKVKEMSKSMKQELKIYEREGK